jgi:hypothetical protein
MHACAHNTHTFSQTVYTTLTGTYSLLVSLRSPTFSRSYPKLYENQNSLFEFTNVRYRSPSQLNLIHRLPMTSHIPYIIFCNYVLKGKGLPQQTEVAQGVPGWLRPRILTFRHFKGVRSSAICTGCLYPRRNPWYSLSESESTSGHMVLSGEPREKIP